jgi:hypothetical protein
MPHTIPGPRAATPAAPAHASVDAGTIRQRFNWDWAESSHDDFDQNTYWWYAISIRVDPNEVIAEDDEGNLWSVPFSTDGEDAVTFGAPVRVRETFVPVTAGNGAAATAAASRLGQRVLASALERPDKPERNTNPAASARPEPQEDKVPDITPDQLQRLRALPEDADQEQIDAALTAEPEAASGEPEAPETPEAPERTEEREPVTAAASAADPIDDEMRRQLEENSRRVAELEAQASARQETETSARRDGLASQWVQEGRITPAERDHYRGMLDIDEDRTVGLAKSLAPGRVPVDHLRGSAATPGTGTDMTTTGWFSQLQEA